MFHPLEGCRFRGYVEHTGRVECALIAAASSAYVHNVD